jgi:hypothetical protein
LAWEVWVIHILGIENVAKFITGKDIAPRYYEF